MLIWIIKNQFARRSIPTAKRCELALRMEDEIKKKAEKKEKIRKSSTYPLEDKSQLPTIQTNEELSKIAGVGHNTMHQYRTINKSASPEIKEKVKSGEMSIKKAYIVYNSYSILILK